MEPSVYLIPYMDGNWEGWGPLDPLMGYNNPPAPAAAVEDNVRKSIPFMQDVVGGKFVLGAHTSTYCRDLFYREPLLGLYRELVAGGGEICLHPHEEAVKVAPLVDSPGHMRAIVGQKRDELLAGGIRPTSFRMGLDAFDDCIPALLESAGIYVDLSAAPGVDRWYWRAGWRNTPLSAYYLCPIHYNDVDCGHAKSQVLEIPWGNDGQGDNFAENFLYNEAATLTTNEQIWDAIVRRSDAFSAPQFVYSLMHLSTMSNTEEKQKFVQFSRYVRAHAGVVVTAAEAKTAYDHFFARIS